MPSVSKNGEFPRVRHSVNINEMMWGPLKLPLHVRLRLKIAPAAWPGSSVLPYNFSHFVKNKTHFCALNFFIIMQYKTPCLKKR